MAILTVQYSAPLPPGFQSGTLELKSQTVYVDKDGRVNQPYYKAAINPNRDLPNPQTGGPLSVVGMAQGDPATASPLDVVVTMNITGLATPLRSTFRVMPLDTGNGYLNLHLPAINVPVIGPPTATLQALIDEAKAQQALVWSNMAGITSALNAANTAVTSANTAIALSQAQRADVDDGLDLMALATALIPPAIDATNLAAQTARDAAATLPCPPVADTAARVAFLNALSGNGSCLQMDTLHVWQKLGGVTTDLGPNSLAIGNGLTSVQTTAGLAAVQAPQNGGIFSSRGAQAESDGGEGLWMWVQSGTRPPDDGILHKWHTSLTNGYFARIWDGVRANFAWAGLAAGAGVTALSTALTVLAGTMLTLDKTYTLTQALDIPAGTMLFGRYGVGFNGSTLPTVLNLLPGVSLNQVNINGQATSARNNAFTANGLFRSFGTLANPVSIVDCTGQAAPDHVVYGYAAHGTRIRNLRVDGCNSEAVYFQMSDYLDIDGVYIRNSQKDGVKIHSKDGQTANQAAHLYGLTVRNVRADYSGQTLTGDTLGVEFWGGQTAFIHNLVAENIHVIGPAAITGGTFFGISADTCKHGFIQNFSVSGGTAKMVGLGIEAAGCIDFTYQNGTVSGYRYTGASLTQPKTKNVKLVNVTFRDAFLTGGTYGVQWFNGIKAGDVLTCTFKDAGDRFLFFNSAGDFVRADGNHFYIGAQATTPNIIYVSGTPKGVKLTNNEFGNSKWEGDVLSTTAWAKPGELAGAIGWHVEGNSFDALRPDGTYGGGAQLLAYGGGGGHRFAHNTGFNFTAAYLGQYDNGPASEFIYNKIYGSGVAAQSARNGSVVDYVVVGVVASAGTAAVPPYTILYHNTVTNATLRTGFPDKTLSSIVFDDSTAHGFPTTKGMLKTDRTGFDLTQYNQTQFDMQLWYAYDDNRTWQRRATLDGNWGAWVRTDLGGVVVSQARNITGITGGHPYCVVIVSGSVARDIHPGMRQETRSYATLQFLAGDGKYYPAGSEVPWPAHGYAIGQRLVLGQRENNTYPNVLALGANIVLDSLASPGIRALEVGWFKDANTLLFLPQFPVEAVDDALPVVDTFAGDAAGSLPARYTDLWVPSDGKQVRVSSRYLNGKELYAIAGTAGRHLLARNDTRIYNGSVLMVAQLAGSSDKQLSVTMRADPLRGAGTETAYQLQLDGTNGQTKIVKYVGGVSTALQTVGGGLSENVRYALELRCMGTLLRGRAWQVGTPRPDWQIETYDAEVGTSGYHGAGFRNGELFVGLIAHCAGEAVLSDRVDVNV